MSGLWEKALEAAEEARLLAAADHGTGATSRAYYAIFTAARVLLAERVGADAGDIRRHAAVLRLFSEHFVRTGLVEPEFGRAIRRLFDRRADADYSDIPIQADEARDTVAVMERFLAVAAALRQATPMPGP